MTNRIYVQRLTFGLPLKAPTFKAGIRISLAGKPVDLSCRSIFNQDPLNKQCPFSCQSPLIVKNNVTSISLRYTALYLHPVQTW